MQCKFPAFVLWHCLAWVFEVDTTVKSPTLSFHLFATSFHAFQLSGSWTTWQAEKEATSRAFSVSLMPSPPRMIFTD